jgi:spore maturation protein SpmA
MRNLDTRSLVLIAIAVAAGLIFLNPATLNTILDTALRVVYIVLGLVGILYLWRRL